MNIAGSKDSSIDVDKKQVHSWYVVCVKVTIKIRVSNEPYFDNSNIKRTD